MSPPERSRALLFLAAFLGAAGLLAALLAGGTEYWLLGAEACRGEQRKLIRIFHEGLFWRCSFEAPSEEYSILDLWFSNQPELCQAAFLFPFPVYEPMPSRVESRGSPTEPYEHPSAIVFRTFWSIFLVAGLTGVVAGGLAVLCAGPLANRKLFRVGGALQLSGGVCLLAVLVMYLVWVQASDTLEEFARHRRLSVCPSYRLGVQHGPSFLLAPVAVVLCPLAGLLFVLVGRGGQGTGPDARDEGPEPQASDV